MIKVSFRTALFFLMGMIIFVPQAFAVDALDPCQSVYEEIMPLRVPDFEQPAVWKKTTGVKGIDKPSAILGVLDGGQIAVGTSVPYDEKTGLGKTQIQFTRTDKTGKIVIEKEVSLDDLKAVEDAALLKNRVVVVSHLGDKTDDWIGLQFLNGVGEIKSTKAIRDSKLRLNPQSVMTLSGDGGIVIAAEAVNRKNKFDSYTVLLWTDKEGNLLAQKEYLPGVQNKPDFIGRLGHDEIVVTGRVKTDGNRSAGWLLRLGKKGEIIFQKSFARGADAVLRRAVLANDGSDDVLVVGDAIPSGQGDKAAWVMRVNGDGKPVWQKYFTGKYNYSGIDILTLKDGRINALLSGRPAQDGGRNYARILTLSLAGIVIGDESFLEGSNAIPVRLIDQKGKRYLLGLAETGFSKKGTPDDLRYVTYDTWILGLAGLQEYHDNCTGSPQRTLDDE